MTKVKEATTSKHKKRISKRDRPALCKGDRERGRKASEAKLSKARAERAKSLKKTQVRKRPSALPSIFKVCK